MLEQFKQHTNAHLSFLKESKLLIAISGGLDSVVLAQLCHALGWNFSLAHCNFNLRGDESDGDEAFVLKLAEQWDVEVFIESFDTTAYANEYGWSTQMAARELRYQYFDDLVQACHFDYVLTAHHADDNLETLLINMSRGTGLDGLTGIPEINGQVLRPLLPFSREEIETYAKERNMHWREDSSNASDKYIRNSIRHHIIPKLKELQPDLLQNISKTQSHLRESQQILNDAVTKVHADVVTQKDQDVYFDIDKIKKLSHPKAYLYEWLKDYGFKEWQDVIRLLEAQSGKQIYSKDYVLLKDRTSLILTPRKQQVNDSIEIQENQISENIKTPVGNLFLEETNDFQNGSQKSIYVDKDLLKFPLVVRPWQNGDYFYPLGMEGKKKVSKYLKDEKLSLRSKETIYLLLSRNEVVWVMNMRPDNRFKITEKTKQILKIILDE